MNAHTIQSKKAEQLFKMFQNGNQTDADSSSEFQFIVEGLIPPGGVPNLCMLGFCPQDVHKSASIDVHGVFQDTGFVGGEKIALERLHEWIWNRDCLRDYFNTRNGMLGADYSTKLSPWLSTGCLSPRIVASECQRYESERVVNKSTYWLVFELIWRDFFRFFAARHGNKIFYEWGLRGQQGYPSWVRDPDKLFAWVEGRTGVPLVDANMRELALTGFMSNRGRQNVASYLVHDLGIDWRLGAAYFEYALIDHDVTSNWGNWLFVAGLTGGRINKFNILKQSKEYDGNGAYVRHWLSELKSVPLLYVHKPESMNLKQQQQSRCIIGKDYPFPIVSQDKLISGKIVYGQLSRGKKKNQQKPRFMKKT